MNSGSIDLVRNTLNVLPKDRLQELARIFGFRIPATASKEDQIRRMTAVPSFEFRHALQEFTRDELKAACRANGLDDTLRARIELARQLLHEYVPTAPTLAAEHTGSDLPRPGEVVLCRQRQYLVESVDQPAPTPDSPDPLTQVSLVCLDDDAAGRTLVVLWELELGARVLRTHEHGLGQTQTADDTAMFAAYVNALRWNCVTATDAQLFQSPFRAGIKLLNHQLTPLQKALSLPRANLFIADDVGLGKTIEAGLILQELILRQRVDFTLIACPASVVLQWRDEMFKKFGLHFEVYNRDFIGQRRRERGFRVNPWSTHTRFIVSHSMLSRPEHRDPLLHFLGDRARKSLLILDEAHAAAPSTASKYAVDSRFTDVIRDVAPRFENRLFLSATPHNGHSNSFTALLHILDPQRFTRGVPVTSDKQLEPIMVRRLKSDLRQIGLSFPKRLLIKLKLEHDGQRWTLDDGLNPLTQLPNQSPIELQLADLLSEYTALCNPTTTRAKFVFVNLQKRLLSSPEAFWRTLQAHARSAQTRNVQASILDDDLYGADDEALESDLDAEVHSASADMHLSRDAETLRTTMLKLAENARYTRDAKMQALHHWIDQNLRQNKTWNARKLLIFTEYGDTKRYIVEHLRDVFADHPERILQFHGAMSDKAREQVQEAFNDASHPVRILVATDAAREGVNLQGACADLVHYDIPWNPSKLEQRNGRIDRTLQPSPEVRCMYFSFPQRTEDRVLEVVLQKVDTIQEELGSLSAVLLEAYEQTMASGINADTLRRVEGLAKPDARLETTRRELESQRLHDRIKREVDLAGKNLDKSRKILNFNREHFRKTVDAALRITTGNGLNEIRPGIYEIPTMPSSWITTLDTLRPVKKRDEDERTWRNHPLRPVVFEAPDEMNAPLVHLHLEHPFVQRLFSRFRSQGYAAHDLARVAVVPNPDASTIQCVALARLSLFGPEATRLHDELISVRAPWFESPDPQHLNPVADAGSTARFIDDVLLQAVDQKPVDQAVTSRLAQHASSDFATLWPAIEADAEARAHAAEVELSRRAHEEARALTQILKAQRDAIQKEVNQISFVFRDAEADQRKQREADIQAMTERYQAIDGELEREPDELRNLFQVALRRLEPVGLVYLWPETR